MTSSIEHDKDKCLPTTDAECDNEDQDVAKAVLNPEDNNMIWREMEQTEKLLASDLYKLSSEERQEAMNDIHGVSEEVEEDPETIDKLLAKFEGLVVAEQNPTYDLAVSQDQAYVEDRSFRLRFLRCNNYDATRSVTQMMNFLKHKATYFGMDKVARDITIDDLNNEDISLLVSGLCHIQEERDQSGRVIQFLMTEMLGRCKAETMIRVAYYVQNNVMVTIPEVQMKGVVGVYYDVTKPGESFVMPGFVALLTVMDVVASFPLRYSALHICLKPRRSSLLLNNTLLCYVLNLASVHTRVRTRIHYGSDQEIQYSLRSYGVPTESFPVDEDGSIRKDKMNVWLQKHETEVRLNQWMSNQPRPEDVLLGRGYRVQNHEGNARFRNFLMSHRDEYDNAPRSLRQDITMRLTRTLVQSGTRFLKRAEDGQWIEIPPDEAEKKVGQLFRTFRKRS